jgi:hypothetical protein
MSTIYRKSRNRTFYKLQDKVVTVVLNRYDESILRTTRSRIAYNDLVANNFESTEECTEAEFNTAYKEAMERIQSGKI